MYFISDLLIRVEADEATDRGAPPGRTRCRPLPSMASHGPDRAHLDGPVTGTRTARRPGQGRIVIGHVDHDVSAKLLLGLGVGPVEHPGRAIGDAHRGCR